MNTQLLEYVPQARSLKSAIEEFIPSSGPYFIEPKDPIIYSNNSLVSDLLTTTRRSGSVHDARNAFSFYHLMPEWVRDEDTGHLKNLSHIIGAYFDELFSHIRTYNTVFKRDYTTEYKIYPYYEELLNSHGFKTENLFAESSYLENFLHRNIERTFASGTLDEAKSLIV